MRFWRFPAFRWGALLGGALVWRLLLFIGAQGSDDLAYSDSAWTVASGSLPIHQGIHGTRIGYVGAIGAFYALFGAGSFSLILLNLTTSVGEVALARLIAREYLDDAGSWLTAFLVAILPVHVFYATEAHPDLPAAALTTCSVLLFLWAKKSDNTGLFVISGVLLGTAHLMKETAFMGLAALAVLGGRPRFKFLLPVAGFATILAAESLLFWTTTGDPLYRLHQVHAMQSEIMHSPYYVETTPTFRRLLIDVPAMFFWPAQGTYLFFAFLPLLALMGVAAARRRRDRTLLCPTVWTLTIAGLLTFWPITLMPYRPAMVAFPRIYLGIAVPMSILASSALRALPQKLSWIVLVTVAAAALGSALLLHADARRESSGARIAHAAIRDLPVVSDPRTIQFLRLYDGYSGRRPLRSWEEPAPSGIHCVVVNDLWIRHLRDWTGTRPPTGFEDPGAAPFLNDVLPGRIRLRTLLQGRVEYIGIDKLRIYRIP
jgi:4-amino-4-deoxy-L-arabinose transferase-like glycosyltransferase